MAWSIKAVPVVHRRRSTVVGTTWHGVEACERSTITKDSLPREVSASLSVPQTNFSLVVRGKEWKQPVAGFTGVYPVSSHHRCIIETVFITALKNLLINQSEHSFL